MDINSLIRELKFNVVGVVSFLILLSSFFVFNSTDNQETIALSIILMVLGVCFMLFNYSQKQKKNRLDMLMALELDGLFALKDHAVSETLSQESLQMILERTSRDTLECDELFKELYGHERRPKVLARPGILKTAVKD